MVIKDLTKTQKKEIEGIIKELDSRGQSINEIDNMLVNDVGLSPESSWHFIKKTLKLKLKKVI